MFSLVLSFLTSRLGIVVLAAALLAGGVFYHKATGWWHEAELARVMKERDAAISKLNQEKQKVADLEKTVQFQRNQIARRQQVQKEVTDVDKAVGNSDLDYLRRNEQRLFDYKNPAAAAPAAGGVRKRFKPPAEKGAVN